MKEQNYIYTIYHEGSFSKAAKKLFVSQPALSMAVKKIEDELGITIFDRSSSPLSLTYEGRIYMDALEEIRSVQRSMKDRLSDMTNLKIGHVTISGENFVTSFILPDILVKFSGNYPGIDIDLVESNSPDLRKLLLSENIDLLIAHDFDPQLYESTRLLEEVILLAVPKDYPTNKNLTHLAMSADDIRKGVHKTIEPVDLSLFADEKFLILKPGNDLCRRAEQLCAEAGFVPNVRIRLDQMITAYNLSRYGMGITFVSDILVGKVHSGDCVFYALKGPVAHRTMSIGSKKNRYINHAEAAFIKTAIEAFRDRDLT